MEVKAHESRRENETKNCCRFEKRVEQKIVHNFE